MEMQNAYLKLSWPLAATETLPSTTAVSSVPDSTVSDFSQEFGAGPIFFSKLPGYWDLLVTVKLRKQRSRLRGEEAALAAVLGNNP